MDWTSFKNKAFDWGSGLTEVVGDFHSWVVSSIVFPLYHWLKRDGLMPAIRQYMQNQWLSEQELKQLQLAKLQRLLRHSRNNVPYYRELFQQYDVSDFGEFDYKQFRRLPLLSKEIINREQSRLEAINFKKQDLVRNSTSGSTGEPLVFYNDRQSLMWRQAVIWRNQHWVHARYSDREAKLWGAQIDISKAESIRGRLSAWVHQTMLLSTYNLSDEAMQDYVIRMQAFKPLLLVSYPSPLVTFAQFLERMNMSLPTIKSIITSAEQLHDWQRDVIERVFGPILYDRYGSREFGNIAHECDVHSGYHVNSERFFLEILGSDGEPVEPGETGELVITDLDNYGFPFIRYPIGDLAVPTDRKCSCGRGLPLVERFEGRSFDMIRCPNGNRVAGTFWTIVMREFSGVAQFQIEQSALDHLTVRLRIDGGWVQSNESSITERVKERCGDDMKISYEYVDSIDLTASGKQKLVVSRL